MSLDSARGSECRWCAQRKRKFKSEVCEKYLLFRPHHLNFSDQLKQRMARWIFLKFTTLAKVSKLRFKRSPRGEPTSNYANNPTKFYTRPVTRIIGDRIITTCLSILIVWRKTKQNKSLLPRLCWQLGQFLLQRRAVNHQATWRKKKPSSLKCYAFIFSLRYNVSGAAHIAR